jgi:hypothetical protein
MIWVTWRQQRLEALIGGVILAMLAAFLFKTGLEMATAFQHSGLASCIVQAAPSQACGLTQQDFIQRFAPLEYPFYQGAIFLPLLFGLLLAAPFVLELEQGTYRLAWTQSITQTRWLLTKLALVVAIATLAGAALAAIATWWWTPLVQLDNRLNRNPFELIGVVPIAYTVFAVALCLAVGTLLRRIVPAIGVTLAGFMALRLWIETQVRYNYTPPLVKRVPLNAGAGLPRGDYIVENTVHIPPSIMHACTAGKGALDDSTPVQACLAQHGIVNVITYQPADRFWPFQAIESAIFLGVAAALLVLTVWWVQHRIR